MIIGIVTSLQTYDTYRSGVFENGSPLYADWTECYNAVGDDCLREAAFNTAAGIPIVVLGAFLIAVGLFIKMNFQMNMRISRWFQKPTQSSELAEKQSPLQAPTLSVKTVAEPAVSNSSPRYVLVGKKNGALTEIRTTTSLFMSFGILISLVAFIVAANNQKNLENLAIASNVGDFGGWLLTIGVAGKVLIGIARAVIEGMGGNTRETDEYRQED